MIVQFGNGLNVPRPFRKLACAKTWPILVLLCTALAVRWTFLGDPDIHLDEQFYLLVGDQMWHGALPFVDIWDRKPIGLFLIYALARPFSSDGVFAYQLAATLAAAATSYVIWRILLRQLNPLTALLPAISYQFWLLVYAGMGGQSPVFYNLPMATAALLTIGTNDSRSPQDIRRHGVTAMMLCGIALQIKYTVVAEGVFFGLYLLWRSYSLGSTWAGLARTAMVFVGVALTPTAIALAYYCCIGHGQAFIFANFISIFLREGLPSRFIEGALLYIVVAGIPLLFSVAAALAKHWSRMAGAPFVHDRLFLTGWMVAALTGFVMIGNFYDHYALPLLPPIIALSGILYETTTIALPLFAVLTFSAWHVGGRSRSATLESRSRIERLSDIARPYLQHGCMFIYDGPSILYLTTHACIPTRFAYPDHLSNKVEDHAIGVDPAVEVQRVLSSRPAVIVTASKPVIPDLNPRTLPLVNHALKRDYVQISSAFNGNRAYLLNVRRDLLRLPAGPSQTGH